MMKIQPGTIILIFLIIMFSFMVFLNSQARTYLEKESNFDSISNKDIYIANSTLLQDLESKITIFKKKQDTLDIFAETDGNLISIDSTKDKLLLQTSSVIQLYDLNNVNEDKEVIPKEISVSNVTSLLPFDLRSEFPLPNIELVQFNPTNQDELLIVISQINENNIKFCFLKRTGQGQYSLSQIPTFTLDKKVIGIRKIRLASLINEEFILILSHYNETKSKISAYFTDTQKWYKINQLDGIDAGYFAIDKSNPNRIDALFQSEKGFEFSSIERITSSKEQTKVNFKNVYSVKTRAAKLQNEIHSAYSITSDDNIQYLFYSEDGKIQQARLINWGSGSFSQVKTLQFNKKASVMPDLGEIWYAILALLAGFVFLIIVALTKRKRSIKQMLSPVDFLKDAKTHKATEKEEEKSRNSDERKLRLLGRNDVERPKKEETPDLGDPFSIYEHFGYLPAGLLIRTLSSGIDLVLLAPVFYWLGGTLGIRIDDLFVGPDWFLAHLVIMLVHFIYFVGFEYYLGKTPGKMLTGIRTVTVENQQMKIWQVVVRNLTRIPDYYLFFVMMFNMRAQRIGDLLTKTVVIFDPKDKELS